MLLILSNLFIFNAVLSLDHRLPKDLLGIGFEDYFLKPHYTSHIIKYISSLAVEAYPGIAQSLRYPKIIGNPIVLLYQIIPYSYISILSFN